MLRPRSFLSALLGLAGMLAASPVAAVDGDFDTTFPGGSGLGRFTIYPGTASWESRASVISLTPGGELLLGGSTSTPVLQSWWLGQILGDGQWDPTFGYGDTGLINSCQLGACYMESALSAALPLATGQVVVLLADALVSTDVGAHAIAQNVPMPISINDAGATVKGFALALQGDGKILVGGNGREKSNMVTQVFGIARFTSELLKDHSFGAGTFDGGNLTMVDPTDVDEVATSVLVQSDGRIVLVGNDAFFDDELELARFDIDGSIDSTFGQVRSPGRSEFLLAPYTVSSKAIVDRTDRILVAMADPAGHPNTPLIVRVDKSGNDYVAVPIAIPFCSAAAISALALDSAGRLLASGYCTDATTTQFLVLRLRAGSSLSLDTSYGTSGFSRGWFDSSSSPGKPAYGLAMTLDGGGRPVIVGYSVISGADTAGIARLSYDLIRTDGFEPPQGCLPPDCD